MVCLFTIQSLTKLAQSAVASLSHRIRRKRTPFDPTQDIRNFLRSVTCNSQPQEEQIRRFENPLGY